MHEGRQVTGDSFNDMQPSSAEFDRMQQDILETLSASNRKDGERLRRHLQFFFMDPITKWKMRHQFPFKLVLQIFKIVFISVQLMLFAELRMLHVDFMDETHAVIRHKFLKNWNNERDALIYPPSSGRYSVYTGTDIVDQFAFMVVAYYSIKEDSFASFSYDTLRNQDIYTSVQINDPKFVDNISIDDIPPMQFCLKKIANVTVFNNTYEFDISEINDCVLLKFNKNEVEEIRRNASSMRKFLEERKITFKPEDALIISKGVLSFNLRTIHFSTISTDERPECFLIQVSIIFDNSRHTGQVYISLSTVISYVTLCNGRVVHGDGTLTVSIIIFIIDVLVLLMCIASLILCCRALLRAHLLKLATAKFVRNVLRRELSLSDQLEFLNFWYVMIVANDICIICGTLCKITIEFRDFDNDLFTTSGVLLGTGALLVYVGVLRYFCFFSKYNILILTVKKSLPNILRFMSCAAVLYAGFLIAGWVIIGPYSLKFRTLGKSSEALFSLINGDDMFATFFTINDSNTIINIVGTAYIYVFVSLFIYVVLSLFIAIIMDAYEVIRDRYRGQESEEKSLLQLLCAGDSCNLTDAEERRLEYSSGNLLKLDCCDLFRQLIGPFCNCFGVMQQEPPYNSFENSNEFTNNRDVNT
ncbi:Coelomocyte uptake defective protein 5, isoform c, putative [Brugia malayi]|uniref:BMA-CUP-5 n=1 Tax=Brugia malayi TaxID=6279 RepID=A0A0H5S9D0_BRUMA|nr:Coelomocyte uptake defective protein 5, isoform c, putative [Brugia malayi]CRZ24740.1 BMA-CUP-5 [Brugia malayi]VIO93350.1 Coelomocyte uptake defective protein 5, isoform c, putative [Brugia malayi]